MKIQLNLNKTQIILNTILRGALKLESKLVLIRKLKYYNFVKIEMEILNN
jgi:hypothetical protein